MPKIPTHDFVPQDVENSPIKSEADPASELSPQKCETPLNSELPYKKTYFSPQKLNFSPAKSENSNPTRQVFAEVKTVLLEYKDCIKEVNEIANALKEYLAKDNDKRSQTEEGKRYIALDKVLSKRGATMSEKMKAIRIAVEPVLLSKSLDPVKDL